MRKKLSDVKSERVFRSEPTSYPLDNIDMSEVDKVNTISPLELNLDGLGQENLKIVVGKLNEVIKKVNQ